MSNAVVVTGGRRTGRVFGFLLTEVRRVVSKHGVARVSGAVCSHAMAKELSEQLGLHCCYRHRSQVYEFRPEPFEHPRTPQERKLWEVIR